MTSGVVVSLFSGAGGLSKGFADAGLTPVLACEIDEDACETYRRNISPNVIRVDIGVEKDRIVREVEVRAAKQEVFAVIGGPPCQGFSTAGSREHNDPRNRLVFAYLDVVAALKPRWFLFENVEGILTSGNGDAVVGLSDLLTQLGYTFRLEKVNFARWGIPQARKRVLIVGNRLGLDFALPPATHAFEGKKHRGHGELPPTTLGDALAGLPAATASTLNEQVSTSVMQEPFESLLRQGKPQTNGHVTTNFQKDLDKIRLLEPGQSLRDLPEALWPESFRSRAFRRVSDGMPTEKRGGPPAGIRRLDKKHASLTITSLSSRELIHPEFDRPLTLRECARLQTFPDSFSFAGKLPSVATQIGNAFPPLAGKTMAEWLIAMPQASTEVLSPGLLGFVLTEAVAMSPALQIPDRRLSSFLSTPKFVAPRARSKNQMSLFQEDESMILGPEDRKTITDGRALGPISMTDREMARLISVVLKDLEHDDLIPEWARGIPQGGYYNVPLSWFTSDEQRPFDFEALYSECARRIEGFRIIFRCITKLHRHRRKFEVILRTQPLPTMDQIARRGLLEFGNIPVQALASWLTWRKWTYDIDNRSAQETGYLFEPMLTESIGGRSVSARNSPVKRSSDPSKGRQVDCIVEVGGRKLAYEFKDRITIAASGQGRFAEELAFPVDCAASGYIPMLLVMDPTPNPKLAAITKAFVESGGQVFLGDQVWGHLEEISGAEIAAFVKQYIKDPVAAIAQQEESLLDLGLKYRTGPKGDHLSVTIGEYTWTIPRPPRESTVAFDEVESEED